MLLYKQTWDQRTSITSSEIVLYALWMHCVSGLMLGYLLDKRWHPWTPLFIAAWLTKAKTQKQSKCSSTAEWINVVYTYSRTLLSLKKGKEIPTGYNMNKKISKISQSQKDKDCMTSLNQVLRVVRLIK